VLPYIQRQRFEPSVDEYLAILQDRVVGLPEEAKLHITKKAEAAEAAEAADKVLPEAEAAVPADAAAAEPTAVGESREKQPEKGGWPKPQRTMTDPITLAQMPSLDYGCCVAMLRDSDAASLGFTRGTEVQGSLAANMPLAISCWRGRGSMNVLVSKQECAQVIERLQAAIAARDKAALAAA